MDRESDNENSPPVPTDLSFVKQIHLQVNTGKVKGKVSRKNRTIRYVFHPRAYHEYFNEPGFKIASNMPG